MTHVEKVANDGFQNRVVKFRKIGSIAGEETWQTQASKNFELGQHVLLEELGYFGVWSGAKYDLSETERNLLAAHTRQDVVVAVAMAQSAHKEAAETKRLLLQVRRLLLAVLCSILLSVGGLCIWVTNPLSI